MKFLFNGKCFRDFIRNAEKHNEESYLLINSKVSLATPSGYSLESTQVDSTNSIDVDTKVPISSELFLSLEKAKSVEVEINPSGISIKSVEY